MNNAFIMVPTIVISYFLTGYLLGCLAVRIEWSIYERRGEEYLSEREVTEMMLRLFWPITVWIFAVYTAIDSMKGRVSFPRLRIRSRLRSFTNLLSTPQIVRKRQ